MKQITVLLVDDQSIIARETRRQLETLGYLVPVIAPSGKRALEALEERHFDLILMDIRLKGGIDGIDTAREIKKNYDIPIIYLTAFSDENTVERAKSTEPFGYIVKPINEHLLRTNIEVALYKHSIDRKMREYQHWVFTTLKSIADGVIATDTECKITFMNYVAERLTGWQQQESLGKSLDSVFIVHEDSSVSSATSTPSESDILPTSVQKILINRSGFEIPIETHMAPIKDDRENTLGMVITFRDITERLRVEQQHRESRERYALAVRGANDGIWDWDLRANSIFYSERWKSMLGYQDNEITDSPDEWFQRVIPAHVSQLRSKIQVYLDGNSSEFCDEHQMKHRDGSWRWMLCRGIAVRNETGKPYRFAGSISDISERKGAEAQLLHDAFHDSLTGLPNRALFMDRLGISIAHTKRRRRYTFSVLFLDLDRFKVVNDSLGHMVGDEFLIAIARRLETLLRPGDTVARLGGDEFAILLQDIEGLSDATRAADRIQRELSMPLKVGSHDVFTSASIGIAMSSTGYDYPEDLLRDADNAMYRAKALGRARHEVFDKTMHNRIIALLELETDLRRALDRKELCIHYQPIVSLETGTISGFEALLRWRHPRRGLMLPEQFIFLAEETGLIIPIGWWVLKTACHQIQHWNKNLRSQPPLSISVNLSSKQFLQPELVQEVQKILEESRLESRSLRLEITESAIMDNPDLAIEKLLQLKDVGVQIHIDDFGTGYSSLSYLHRFPTDLIKIDRSFVSSMKGNDENAEIVRTIVTLARNLHMNVTAEGLETPEQLLHLRSLECEFGQGFYFSRPVDCYTAKLLISSAPKW